MAKYLMIFLAAIAVWLLFRGMRQELGRPDPAQAPSLMGALWTVHNRGLACDAVNEFRYLGERETWVYYLVRCGDGGRYLYAQSSAKAKIEVATCQEMAQHGWYCPQD